MSKIAFEYNNQEYTIEFHIKDKRIRGKRTICWIKQGDDIFSTGGTDCHESDRFVKETGRKISLKYALKLHTKEFRTAAWKAYFDRKTGCSHPDEQKLYGDNKQVVAKWCRICGSLQVRACTRGETWCDPLAWEPRKNPRRMK
jgi:hypothetical protein